MNKSIELAKLLNIKPLHRMNVKLDNTPEGNIIGKAIEDSVEIYPDLTKPSNFVKLLEICSKSFSIELPYMGDDKNNIPPYRENWTFVEIILESIKLHLEQHNGTEVFDEVNRQTQQTEWEY